MQATFQTRVQPKSSTAGVRPLHPFPGGHRFLAESVNDISTVQHILLARLGEADAALIRRRGWNVNCSRTC